MTNRPGSGREYITSYTTTTSTTVRPDIVKGVEIIRNLVEQAKTTTEIPAGAVQSLTTMRSMKNIKSYNIDSSINPGELSPTSSTTPMRIPPNHKLSPLDTTPIPKARATTTVRTRHRTLKPQDSIEDSFELDKPSSTTRRPIKQTTTTATSTTSATTRSSNQNLPKPQTTLPIGINDIEDLLNRLPSTTARMKTTTTRKPKTTTHAPEDDLLFLRQLV